KFMVYFPITLSVVLSSSLFVALIINSVLTSEFMKVEEEPLSKRKLIRWSLILLGVGALLLLAGFTMDIAAFRGFGNLAILTSILLWLYKYVLAGAVEYFQFTSLKKMEDAYEKTLKYALRGRKAYVFFFGTIILLLL